MRGDRDGALSSSFENPLAKQPGGVVSGKGDPKDASGRYSATVPECVALEVAPSP
jgi:hypothetical protein